MPSAIEEIMKRACVSRATAYRALTGHGPVNELTKKRVLEAAEKLGRPVLTRRARSSKRVGLWFPGLGHLLSKPHHVELVKVLERMIEERGLSLEIISTPIPRVPEEAIAMVKRARVKGLLLMAVNAGKAMEALASEWPVVSFFSYEKIDGLTVVTPDDFSAGFKAVRHLTKRGHRRVTIAVGSGGIPESFSQRFAAGCALAMQEAGLQFGESWVMRNGDNLRWFGEAGEDPPAVEWFLHMSGKPTAIVGRAETVMGLLRGFARRGVKVPEDVSVVSHGPMGMALLPGHKMDQMEYSLEDMAEAGLDALASRSRHCRRITVEVRLVEGESVKKI